MHCTSRSPCKPSAQRAYGRRGRGRPASLQQSCAAEPCRCAGAPGGTRLTSCGLSCAGPSALGKRAPELAPGKQRARRARRTGGTKRARGRLAARGSARRHRHHSAIHEGTLIMSGDSRPWLRLPSRGRGRVWPASGNGPQGNSMREGTGGNRGHHESHNRGPRPCGTS